MIAENTFSHLAARLVAALDLQQPPVAIGFSSSIPTGMGGHTGRVPAGCRFWEDAASAAFATSAADHNLCAIGVCTHHLHESPSQQTDLMDALKVFGELGYVTPQDLAAIPVLKSQHEYVLYSPLSNSPFAPDVVLLFVHAASRKSERARPGQAGMRGRAAGHEYGACRVESRALWGPRLPRCFRPRHNAFRDPWGEAGGLHEANRSAGEGESRSFYLPSAASP